MSHLAGHADRNAVLLHHAAISAWAAPHCVAACASVGAASAASARVTKCYMNASTAAQAAERREPPAQQMPFASRAPLQRRAARLLQLGRDAQRLRPSGPALQSHRPVRHSRFDFSGVFRSAMVEGRVSLSLHRTGKKARVVDAARRDAGGWAPRTGARASASATAAMWRRARREAARLCFVAALLAAALFSWLVALLSPLLGGGERGATATRAACKLSSTLALRILPWVRFEEAPPAEAWDAFRRDAAAGAGAVLVLNHASGMDPLVLVALCPWRVIVGLPLRVLVHAAHFSLPLFGRVCSACGHFPVHLQPRGAAPGRRVNRALQVRRSRSAAASATCSQQVVSMLAGGRHGAGGAARGARRRAGCLSGCVPRAFLASLHTSLQLHTLFHRPVCGLPLRCASALARAAQRGDARRRAALRRWARFTRAHSQSCSRRARLYGLCCSSAPTHSRPRMPKWAASRRASARGWCSFGRASRPAPPTLRPLRWQRRAAPRCSGSWTTCFRPSRRHGTTPRRRCCRAETLLSMLACSCQQAAQGEAQQHAARRGGRARLRSAVRGAGVQQRVHRSRTGRGVSPYSDESKGLASKGSVLCAAQHNAQRSMERHGSKDGGSSRQRHSTRCVPNSRPPACVRGAAARRHDGGRIPRAAGCAHGRGPQRRPGACAAAHAAGEGVRLTRLHCGAGRSQKGLPRQVGVPVLLGGHVSLRFVRQHGAWRRAAAAEP